MDREYEFVSSKNIEPLEAEKELKFSCNCHLQKLTTLIFHDMHFIMYVYENYKTE